MSSNWTASNALSVSRIFLTVPLVYFLSLDTPADNWIAFCITLVVIASDYLDGKLARRHGQITDLGKKLDPLADKLLIGSAAVYFAFFRGNMPVWFAVLLLGKDALILLGGSILVAKRVAVQADLPGKYTTVVVALTLICFIFNLDELGKWVVLVAAVFVLHSTYFYCVKFLELVRQQK